MPFTWLETREDLDWLTDVHEIPTDGIACALIEGNEDSPNRVELYTTNHYQCPPMIWEADQEGILRPRHQQEK